VHIFFFPRCAANSGRALADHLAASASESAGFEGNFVSGGGGIGDIGGGATKALAVAKATNAARVASAAATARTRGVSGGGRVRAAEVRSDKPAATIPVAKPSVAVTASPRSTQMPKEFRAGDWNCSKCRAHVFASKTSCFRCRAPKPVIVAIS